MVSRAMTRTVLTGLAATTLTVATIAATTGVASATDTSAGTTVTFTLQGGSLSISAPASGSLGTAEAGSALVGTLQAELGQVTVTDERDKLLSDWSASARASEFSNLSEPNASPIAASSLGYLAIPDVAMSANVALTPVALAAMSTEPLPVVTAAASGNNVGVWVPQLTLTVPAQAVAGTYTGTITHSVS
jgi:hypothetical protein